MPTILPPVTVLDGCPELPALQHALREHPQPVREAALGLLANPTTPMIVLAGALGCDFPAVAEAARILQAEPAAAALTASAWYPFRLRWRFAAAATAEAAADPAWWHALRSGQGVLAKTVELHASVGTCGYRCVMCLWSDQDELTYQTRQIAAGPPLTQTRWTPLLDTLAERGAHTVVVSGGGESLLNPALPTILTHALGRGLRVHLYTTGFHLQPSRAALWQAALCLQQIRFSIHAATPALYDQIAGLPKGRNGLTRVCRNLKLLLDARAGRSTSQIGIGFVSQPLNHHQLTSIADLAATLGVDYLDIRKDEVDVTAPLTPRQHDTFCGQLRQLRANAAAGHYGPLRVELSDELVALANDQPAVLAALRARTPACLAKYFRPAVSPYGIVAPCDLTAEPRFANQALELGRLRRQPLPLILDHLPGRHIPDACAACMPSSRSGNAVYHKLLADAQAGIPPAAQPFMPPAPATTTTTTPSATTAFGAKGRRWSGC